MKNTIILILSTIYAVFIWLNNAEARVDLPEKFIASMGFSNCSTYTNGCQFASNGPGATEVEASYYETIKDGVAVGVNAFLFDATSNSSGQEWRITRLANAMVKYNNENPSSKRCIAVMYESGASPLGLFNAADISGASNSPYCTLGGKPLIGIWGNGVMVDPLPGLSGKGPFVVLATIWNTATNIPTSSNVAQWKANGASRVLSYWWVSGHFNASSVTKMQATKAAVEATGAEFVMGIGSTRGANCGSESVCSGSKGGYTFSDGNGWTHTLQEMTNINAMGLEKAMYTMSFPGDYGEGSYFDSSLVCDARDIAVHSGSIGGIDTNFTCPNVPAHLKGTIATGGHYKSYENLHFTHRGHHRVAQDWNYKFRNGTEPLGQFIAFMYRQHPLDRAGTGDDICPTASYTLNPSSAGGTSWGDNIFVTSNLPVATSLRVKVGTTVIGTYTLPAKQMFVNGSTRQTVIPWGSRRGNPVFEVLDSNGAVTHTYEGLVEYTDTPVQRDGVSVGRNMFTYSDFFTVAAPQTSEACINQIFPQSNFNDTKWGNPWDVLKSKSTPTLTGVNCGTGETSFQAQAGILGRSDVYVHKTGYYWNGTEWVSFLFNGENAVGEWFTGTATSTTTIPVNSNSPRYIIAAICSNVGSNVYKCGCKDATCTQKRYTFQSVLSRAAIGDGDDDDDDPPPIVSAQCDYRQVPPAAKAAGLTKLAFCDDFSDITKSFDLTSANWNENVLWNRDIPFTKTQASPSSFSITDGILKLNPDADAYQWTILSAALTNTTSKGWAGYVTGQGTSKEFYAEIRWKLSNKSAGSGFPGFWAMDACHVLRTKFGDCKARTWEDFGVWNNPNYGYYIEPDMGEDINNHAHFSTHLHAENGTDNVHLGYCNRNMPWTDVFNSKSKTDFWVSAEHYYPGGSHEVRWYVDDSLKASYGETSDRTKCYDSIKKAWGFDPRWMRNIKYGEHVINLGLGPATAPIYVDYIRVWEKP